MSRMMLAAAVAALAMTSVAADARTAPRQRGNSGEAAARAATKELNERQLASAGAPGAMPMAPSGSMAPGAAPMATGTEGANPGMMPGTPPTDDAGAMPPGDAATPMTPPKPPQ